MTIALLSIAAVFWALGLGILGTDGVPPMKAGGKRQLMIQPDLTYCSRSAGSGVLPPNAALVFDVEYLGTRGR